ncbi:MAG: ABC transporter ATP-binding protein [Pseudobdellovibrio sp.]
MSFSKDFVIRVSNISKCYDIYETPVGRLKQLFLPRVRKILGKVPKKYLTQFFALNNISFEVKKGETIGIIGKNGSGKSTLLQIICGTLFPTSGSVQIRGRIAALLELGSGFNPEFTGRENIVMSGMVLGLTRTEIEARFDEIVHFADIGSFIDQPVKTYSSGMYVRLAFSIIAHIDADILVIDEALAVGDAFFTQKCMRYLRNFMKTGVVLFVSHDTASITSLCTRAIWLAGGNVIQMGSPKEICESYLQASLESLQGKSNLNVALLSELVEVPIAESKITVASSQGYLLNNKMGSKKIPTSSFGHGDALIVGAYLLDINGNPLPWIVGAEIVRIVIAAEIIKDLSSLIIGFQVRDRLGQVLFGDNTFLKYENNPFAARQNDILQADFVFMMPLLPTGEYSVTASVASGTQDEHIQQHWIHDAIIFRSETSRVSHGLVGIPMLSSELKVIKK